MKKLIIAVAIGLLGVVGNAAQALWDLDTVYASDGSGETADGYLVYYFDTMKLSIADAQANLAANDFSFLSKGAQAYDLLDAGYAEGSSGAIYNAKDDVNGYLVIFDAGAADSATAAFISGTETAKINDLGANVNLSFGDLDDSISSDNWIQLGSTPPTPPTPPVVPEPTSGLLLLLGAAGLALRRKQA